MAAACQYWLIKRQPSPRSFSLLADVFAVSRLRHRRIPDRNRPSSLLAQPRELLSVRGSTAELHCLPILTVKLPLLRVFIRFLYRRSPIRLENLYEEWHLLGAGRGFWHPGLVHDKAAVLATLLRAAHQAPQGAPYVGRHRVGPWPRLLCSFGWLRGRVRPAVGGRTMIFDYSLAGLVTAGLMIYLVYALLQPERF
jgi:K+-transporting ATPase KdpF subunit